MKNGNRIVWKGSRGQTDGPQQSDHSMDGVEMSNIIEGDENILPVRLESMGEAPESCEWWMGLSDR